VDTSAANSLASLKPVSRIWGFDRGTPIDHYYLQQFLSTYADDIRGHVLELSEPKYTRQFGGARVTQSDVLHLVSGNPQATLIGDLSTGVGIPSQKFDCLIVTNTFLLIYDVRAALANCCRALKPGGVLLAHFNAINSRVPKEAAWDGDFWRFTSASTRRLCEEVFPSANIELSVYGNVRAATALLYGLAAEELQPLELDYNDPAYEVVIAVRAIRPL
jgi:SAM-dependent methyltransferase